MRQLHVLGVSDDGEALLLGQSTGKVASHRLRLDDKLRAAVRGQLSAAGAERAESALSPKEMQARLREGASPEEVAKEAQVPVARVLPYAAPVIAERERIVDQARAAMLHRSRGPNGSRPLGELVDAHLADTVGFKPDSVEWTASRRRDGAWVVLLSYSARGGRRAASWLWRPVERDLTALDASATRLAAEEATTSRRRPAAPKRAAKPRPGKRSAGTRATKKAARRPAVKKVARKKVAQKTGVQQKAAQRKAAQKKVAQTTRAARPAAKPAPKATASSATRQPRTAAKPAVRKTVAKRAAARPAAKKVVAKAAATKVGPTKARPAKPEPQSKRAAGKAAHRAPQEAPVPVRPTVVPDPVINEPGPPIVVIPRPQPEPAPEPEAEPIVARRPGQRVPLPSWSDVLLGVVPPEPSRQDATARRRRKSG